MGILLSMSITGSYSCFGDSAAVAKGGGILLGYSVMINIPQTPVAQYNKCLFFPYTTCCRHVNRDTLLVVIVLGSRLMKSSF